MSENNKKMEIILEKNETFVIETLQDGKTKISVFEKNNYQIVPYTPYPWYSYPWYFTHWYGQKDGSGIQYYTTNYSSTYKNNIGY